MKIPTAEEIYTDFHFNYKGDENRILEAMREFAKLHVKAALKAALEDSPYGSSTDIPTYEDIKNAILNAYPETNIK